jgi:hypothetical protein
MPERSLCADEDVRRRHVEDACVVGSTIVTAYSDLQQPSTQVSLVSLDQVAQSRVGVLVFT